VILFAAAGTASADPSSPVPWALRFDPDWITRPEIAPSPAPRVAPWLPANAPVPGAAEVALVPALQPVSYRRDIVMVDGAAIGLLAGGTVALHQSSAWFDHPGADRERGLANLGEDMFYGGVTGLAFGSAMLHLERGRARAAAGSSALRIGLAASGYAAGDATAGRDLAPWTAVAGLGVAQAVDCLVLAQGGEARKPSAVRTVSFRPVPGGGTIGLNGIF
jgi:hypothetical protein